MQLLRRVLIWIAQASYAHPKIVISVFVISAIAGFSTMPHIKISMDLTAGVAEDNPVINLARESIRIFGEQDSLIIVVQFPEPPGRERLPFLRGLEHFVSSLPGVRRVRCQFVDPQDRKQVEALLRNFLLGLNATEREEIQGLFRESRLSEAFSRNRNRLFLTEDPVVRQQILGDPLELGHFVVGAMRKRLGAVSLSDMFLLIASPDSTVYLIQVTPTFPSSDITNGEALIDLLKQSIPQEISRLLDQNPGMARFRGEVQWWLTGKTAFHNESNEIFRRESVKILAISAVLVFLLLFIMYRSFWSGILLLIPIAAGIGPNYGLLWLVSDEVNPVVMGSAGVLFGLATDYGVHLWARLSDEVYKHTLLEDAVCSVYEHTGPPVIMGAFTCILAFLCMCFSTQPAMAQFGFVGASGLVLSLFSTLFLFPALVAAVGAKRQRFFPCMRVSLKQYAHLYDRRPWATLILSLSLIGIGAAFGTRVSSEPDMFKVFLARDMESTNVSNFISRKFKTSFGQPVLLSFDTEDFDYGLQVQRRIDEMLTDLIHRDKEIASADSISYLQSPSSIHNLNLQWIREVIEKWPQLSGFFSEILQKSDLSESATQTMSSSFHALGELLKDIVSSPFLSNPYSDVERSWYVARVNDAYRFLTQLRYVNEKTRPEELAAIDNRIMRSLETLPVRMNMTGLRQAMNEILSSLLSELLKVAFYTVGAVLLFFMVMFRRPLGVALSLLPMIGAFAITLGAMAILGLGLPFSVVGVAPLIFGLGMDNGVHVVMGTLSEKSGGVSRTMEQVTGPIIFTSLTNVAGFVAMLTSQLYAMEFLGWAMIIGMSASVALTLTALPAFLLLWEKKAGIHALYSS